MNGHSNNHFTSLNTETYLDRLIRKVSFKPLPPSNAYYALRQIRPQLIYIIPHFLINNLNPIYRKLNSTLNVVRIWDFSIEIVKIHKFLLDFEISICNYHSIYSL